MLFVKKNNHIMLKIMNIIFVSLNEPTKELTLIGDELINDFLNAISGNSLPDTNGIVNIEEPLIYTADLKENIENLVSKYKHIIPQIQAQRKFLVGKF